MYDMDAHAIRVGTSGWQYGDWKGVFYPDILTSSGRLAYYAERMATVEINSTFYHMPRIPSVEKWNVETPAHFKITLKLNRYFTHTKKLHLDDEFVAKLDEFFIAATALDEKLACVLVQLPPSLRCDVELLRDFLDAVAGRVTIALECRHESWMIDAVRKLLEKYEALWAINDSPNKWPSMPWVIRGRVYIRMHGREKLYASSYSDTELAEMLSSLRAAGTTCGYVYFNNTIGGAGIRNALTMKDMITTNAS